MSLLPWQNQYLSPRQCLAGQGDGFILRRLNLIPVAHALEKAAKRHAVEVVNGITNGGWIWSITSTM